MSHKISDLVITSPINESSRLRSMSHHVSDQWVITSPTNEPSSHLPMSQHFCINESQCFIIFCIIMFSKLQEPYSGLENLRAGAASRAATLKIPRVIRGVSLQMLFQLFLRRVNKFIFKYSLYSFPLNFPLFNDEIYFFLLHLSRPNSLKHLIRKTYFPLW